MEHLDPAVQVADVVAGLSPERASWIGRAQSALGFIFIGSFIAAAFWARFPLPYRDDWDLISSALSRPLALQSLFVPHNEHLIPLPRLLLAWQLAAFGPAGWACVVLALALQIVTAAIVWREVAKVWPAADDGRRVLFGLMAACLFSAYQLQSVIFTAAVLFPMVETFAVAAIACWLNASNASPRRARWLAGSLVFAIAAALTTTNGFGVAALLAGASLVRRDRPRAAAAFGALLAAAVAVYVLQVVVPGLGVPAPARPSFAAQAVFLLSFFGSGLAQFSLAASVAVGVAGLAAFVWASLTLLRERERADRLLWFGGGVMAFNVLSALMAAVGRAQFGTLQAAQSRYATFAFAFWAVAAPLLVRRVTRGSKRGLAPVLSAGALFVTVALFLAHAFMAVVWKAKEANVAAAGLAVAADVHDDLWIAGLHPVPEVVYLTAAMLDARGLRGLRDPRLGQTWTPAVPGALCAGAVALGPTPSGDGYRLTGFLPGGFDSAVVLDRDGRVRGVARPAPLVDTPAPETGTVVADVLRAFRTGRTVRDEWLGFVQQGAGAPYTLIALAIGDRAVCQITPTVAPR